MEHPILVSVLMTSFNRQDYIAEAIESVLASSYKNFELIISDDASTDKTVVIAKSYALQDSRVHVFCNEINLGDYPNRNKAAAYSRGKYIKYLDSDDRIAVDGLLKMVQAMEAFPEAALGIAQFDTVNCNQQFPVCITPKEAYLAHYDGQGILRYGPTGTIIKRDIFFEFNCFDKARFLGDTAFWLKLASKYPIIKIEPGVVFWRVHHGQEFQVGQREHAYLQQSYPIFIKSLLSPHCPLPEKDVERIILRLRWKHARDIISLAFRKGHFRLAYQIFKESDFGIRQLLRGVKPYNKVKDQFIRTL